MSDDSLDRSDATDDADATDDPFSAERDRARELLTAEGVEALHVGVVRDGEVDTTFAQRDAEDASEEGLRRTRSRPRTAHRRGRRGPPRRGRPRRRGRHHVRPARRRGRERGGTPRARATRGARPSRRERGGGRSLHGRRRRRDARGTGRPDPGEGGRPPGGVNSGGGGRRRAGRPLSPTRSRGSVRAGGRCRRPRPEAPRG